MIAPPEMLREAKLLLAVLSGARSESRQRTIISRSYYAAFHHLRTHARCRDYRRDRDRALGMHRDFISHLVRSKDPELAFAGRMLDRLYRLRIDADYRLDLSLNPESGKDGVAMADYLCHEAISIP